MKFMITFGQAHPLKDNWIEVEASNEGEARKALFDILGAKWAFIYEETEFEPKFYQGGKVGRTIIGD